MKAVLETENINLFRSTTAQQLNPEVFPGISAPPI
ncbi:hypothetical protein predicted by Glimmer/Critica [Acetobacter senegalensis]|uniref:Uncharacterized protein n=1 Tax=Acetobacter senegalensis TaxID=446692 RepID=A0A0U5BA06_9PROT|nr:hypothetical protein predicted by Glimmer/Critica [Acetobacter senegalensis]